MSSSILDCALGRVVLLDWFLRAYFSFHSQVRLRFKLAAGLGDGVGMVVFPGFVLLVWCSLWPSMSRGVVILSLCLMSNRSFVLIILSVVRSVLVPFFDSSRFTALYDRSVGQDVSLGECVLLSTSKSVRKPVKLWDVSGSGCFWKVQLDVRDLGGHLDFTMRARAGTLSKRVPEATFEVASVDSLPLGFQVKLGLVRGEYLPAGLHAGTRKASTTVPPCPIISDPASTSSL